MNIILDFKVVPGGYRDNAARLVAARDAKPHPALPDLGNLARGLCVEVGNAEPVVIRRKWVMEEGAGLS